MQNTAYIQYMGDVIKFWILYLVYNSYFATAPFPPDTVCFFICRPILPQVPQYILLPCFPAKNLPLPRHGKILLSFLPDVLNQVYLYGNRPLFSGPLFFSHKKKCPRRGPPVHADGGAAGQKQKKRRAVVSSADKPSAA